MCFYLSPDIIKFGGGWRIRTSMTFRSSAFRAGAMPVPLQPSLFIKSLTLSFPFIPLLTPRFGSCHSIGGPRYYSSAIRSFQSSSPELTFLRVDSRHYLFLLHLVGMERIELPISCSQNKRLAPRLHPVTFLGINKMIQC